MFILNSDSYEYNNDSQYAKIMVLDDDFDIATLVKMTLQRNDTKTYLYLQTQYRH